MKLSNAHEETLKAVLEMFMYLERLQTLKSLQNMHDSYLKSFSGLIFTDTRPTFDSFIQTESNKFCVILHTVNSMLMQWYSNIKCDFSVQILLVKKEDQCLRKVFTLTEWYESWWMGESVLHFRVKEKPEFQHRVPVKLLHIHFVVK